MEILPFPPLKDQAKILRGLCSEICSIVSFTYNSLSPSTLIPSKFFSSSLNTGGCPKKLMRISLNFYIQNVNVR